MTRVSKHFLCHDVTTVAFTSSFVVTHSSEDDTISLSPYLFLVGKAAPRSSFAAPPTLSRRVRGSIPRAASKAVHDGAFVFYPL